MNENHVKNLLSRHGDEILNRRTVKRAKRQVAWKPILIGAVGCAIVGAFLLVPKTAEAAKIVKLKRALSRVHSVEMQSVTTFKNNQWHQRSRNISQGSRYRLESEMSRKVSLTVICDGKSQLIFYNTLPYATMSPLAASEKSKIESAYEDPLMEVFSYFEGFPTSPDISVRSSSGTEVNGRATYVIEARRKDNHHSLRVVVDKASELPIESIFSNPTQNFESERKTEYAYNKSYPDSLFSISNTKEIVNAKREQSILAKKWTQPKLDTKTTPVYESSISPDGTIWICFGEDNTSYVKSAPAEVICDGVKYVGAFDWSSEYSSTGQGFLVNKKAMMISAFVPIHEPTGRPTTATIRFGAIDRNKRDFFPAPPSGASEMRVELNLDKHDFPDYARPFGFDHMARNLSTPLWHAKALAREKESDLLGAAQAYEQEAEACKQFVEYVAFRPLREAARLYERLGQLAKATELRSRADELERTRIR